MLYDCSSEFAISPCLRGLSGNGWPTADFGALHDDFSSIPTAEASNHINQESTQLTLNPGAMSACDLDGLDPAIAAEIARTDPAVPFRAPPSAAVPVASSPLWRFLGTTTACQHESSPTTADGEEE